MKAQAILYSCKSIIILTGLFVATHFAYNPFSLRYHGLSYTTTEDELINHYPLQISVSL